MTGISDKEFIRRVKNGEYTTDIDQEAVAAFGDMNDPGWTGYDQRLVQVSDINPSQALKHATGHSQAAWAKKHGLSPAYVSDVINGRRDPGKSILEALGLERVVSYREKAKSTPPQPIKGDEK